MDYIHYLGQLSYNPFLIIILFLLALIAVSFIRGLLTMAFAKAFSTIVSDISIFGFKFTRNKEGNWEKVGHKPGITFSVEVKMDLKKTAGWDSKKAIRMEGINMMLVAIRTLVIGIGIFVACMAGTFNSNSYILASCSFLFGISVLICSIARAIMTLRIVIKVRSKSLSGYAQAALGMLRSGVPFEKLDLKPVSELGFKKVWESERRLYFLIYFEYLDNNEMFDKLPMAVNDVECALGPAQGAGAKIDIAVSELLVYYYSYHNIVPSKAKDYYHRIADEFAKDTDSFSSCLKGFYELNCFGNVDKAKEFVVKSLEKFDDIQSSAEKEYTQKVIARLNKSIDNFPVRQQ